MKDMEARMKKD
jgi:hypothetical protein